MSEIHHEFGSTCAVRSNAIQRCPGSRPASCRSPRPWASTPAAITISAIAVRLKNTPTFSRTACRYSSQHSVTAAARPSAAPTSGAAVVPDARAAVHRNRVVSSPSRPTARKAVTVSAPAPTTTARSTSPRRCADRPAAARRIQNTMPVTRPTASTLSSPSAASCARLDSSLVENVSTAAKLPATITAPSTPSQTGADDTRRPPAPVDAVLRSAASRMLTTRPASRPSRRPIRKFGTASAHVTRTKVRQT